MFMLDCQQKRKHPVRHWMRFRLCSALVQLPIGTVFQPSLKGDFFFRGRPKKSEGPRKKPPKVGVKLVSPPFADETPDPDSLMPKDYRGRYLRSENFLNHFSQCTGIGVISDRQVLMERCNFIEPGTAGLRKANASSVLCCPKDNRKVQFFMVRQ